MIDIRFLRENPEAVKENIRKKFQDAKLPLVDEVVDLDAKRRAAIAEVESLKAARNKLSKANGPLYGQLKKCDDEAKKAELKEYGIVAVALGDGLVNIFRDLNVDKVVDGGQTMNPSIQDLAEAAEATGAKNVFILPNNTNIILAAQQAKDLTDKNVIVLPTKSVPMGISAALAFNPEASVEENTAAMTEAAENVNTASITFAVRDTNYDSHEIHSGDIMGMINNKLEVLGHEIDKVAEECAEKMVSEDSSLITIYYGADVEEAQAQALCDQLAEKYSDCDVDVQNGGQPLYYYLIAVE